MNVDMDTDDWLGCPTPLEMYKHQCSILVDELVETERMLRRARANIAGLVQMNDLLMKGKAQAEQQLSLASSELADLKGSLTEPGVLSIRLVAGQRDHFMRENQRLLAELKALHELHPSSSE
ncbi:hypothetical protein G7021_12855 [Pseudomonas carnis]|uniref:Uncharacterized protein n=3 Tax=Pseudomonas TaxID=286 RepID=A0ABT5RD78_9PSED|nr:MULTISPECIES: hypothetical protein [Pseudomonas]TPV60226.1 hypothetical protein FJ692_03530 [Pseudomonas fluorescens]EIK67475.1 hypothetical protein PseBG33_1392 [Pseudomonas synxantha BG33R]MBA1253531.1 hypothetical protein [Pseudomonas carnis]MCP9736348.1 hypothetical protein [Pseudomonas sp. GBPI_506]MDD1943927.1 hypothetical protein [Pseudomonas carnis]